MKNLPFKVFCTLAFCALNILNLSASEIPKAEYGVLDLREWNFAEQGEIALDGQWKFYWEQLLLPSDIKRREKSDYFEIPETWNDKLTSATQLKGQGYATYQLTIVLATTDRLMALEIPDMYSSYKLWVNGEVVAENGQVGTGRKESVAQWLPRTIVFKSDKKLLDIVLQVSNFVHKRGGLNDHIYLGHHDQLLAKRENAVATNVVLTGGLGLIGCFFIILFFFFKKDRAAIYFAAICITWAIRSVFTNLYLFINAFPNFDWELGVKIEYLTLYLTVMWTLVFISKMFPNDTNKKIRYGLMILNGVFIVLAVITPAIVYTSLSSIYMYVLWVVMGYVVYVVVRALIFGRAGALFTAVSIILGVVMFTYDTFTYRQIFDFNPLMFNIGYMIIFFLNATAIARQLSLGGSKPDDDQLSYDDMKMRDAV